MVIEFVVNVGCLNSTGHVDTIPFVLDDFKSDSNGTGYQKLKAEVLKIPKDVVVWIMIGFVSIEDTRTFPLLVMQGTLDWFSHVEYFKKVIGDAGGGISNPVSCGFIDSSRSLRVELENGVVHLRTA